MIFFSTEKNQDKKAKDLKSPWITNGIKKSSKHKQRLYNKFLKNKNEKNETEKHIIRIYWKLLKKHSKKNHFSNLMFTFKNNI